LGALASRLHGVPLLLSEHGVYLKERIEDIRKSTWLADGNPFARTLPFDGDLGTFKQLWIEFFDFLGQLAYRRAERITALYRGNARLQMEFGADAAKVEIIPNGIDTARFAEIASAKLSRVEDNSQPVTVGFLGRVVPIKDVKTLLRAARLVGNHFPGTRFLVAGPAEEDPEYFEECLALTKQLGIERMVEFSGRMNPADFLAQSDIVLLTSISEGLPFAILEASAAGLPVVATDVGSCRELLTFPVRAENSPGPSGLVTEVANPGATAAALNHLVGSAALRKRLGANGLLRVEAAYRQEDIVRRYRNLYLAPRAGVSAHA
jgi:glycosyltransferase involved in cell wall biosynthesis